MSIERIPIETESQWLAARRNDVTASVIGALFGEDPRETVAGLHARVTGVEMPDETNEMTESGLLLEEPVARAIAKREGWEIDKNHHYVRDPDARLGATKDFVITNDPRGPIPLEIKVVAEPVFRAEWGDVPPFRTQLQAAVQAMLDDAPCACIGAFECGSYRRRLHVYHVPRVPGAEKRIRDAVAAFWADVDGGREPKIDFRRDRPILELRYPHSTPGKILDLRGDNRLPDILDRRERLLISRKEIEAEIDALETEVLDKLKDAESAVTRGWIAGLKEIHRKAYEVKATTYRRFFAKREA